MIRGYLKSEEVVALRATTLVHPYSLFIIFIFISTSIFCLAEKRRRNYTSNKQLSPPAFGDAKILLPN